ncbi:hypothetical protein ES703_02713 [subsurface metagenome]
MGKVVLHRRLPCKRHRMLGDIGGRKQLHRDGWVAFIIQVELPVGRPAVTGNVLRRCRQQDKGIGVGAVGVGGGIPVEYVRLRGQLGQGVPLSHKDHLFDAYIVTGLSPDGGNVIEYVDTCLWKTNSDIGHDSVGIVGLPATRSGHEKRREQAREGGG